MFVVLIVSCYTANLAAFLTVTNIANTVTSAEELVAQSRIEYGTIRGGGSYETLKVLLSFLCSNSNRILSNQNSKIRTVKAMVAEIEKRSMFTSTMEEGILKAGDGNFAYIAESSIFAKWTRKKDARFIRWDILRFWNVER